MNKKQFLQWFLWVEFLFDFVLMGYWNVFLAFSKAPNLIQHSFWDFICAKIIQAKFSTARKVRRQKRNSKIHTFLNISPPLCFKHGISLEDDKNMRISKYIFFWPIKFQI